MKKAGYDPDQLERAQAGGWMNWLTSWLKKEPETETNEFQLTESQLQEIYAAIEWDQEATQVKAEEAPDVILLANSVVDCCRL